MNLSSTMLNILNRMKADNGDYMIASYGDRTMNALQRRGLVRYAPYAKRDGVEGAWILTKEGKQYASH